jgi:hypothetical protein
VELKQHVVFRLHNNVCGYGIQCVITAKYFDLSDIISPCINFICAKLLRVYCQALASVCKNSLNMYMWLNVL